MSFRDGFDRKGQSAIEYLMTYGWMLLVVAIVGGAIFATVNNQRSSCQGEIPSSLMPGQTADGFGVDQFGVTSSNAQVVVANQGSQDVEVQSVSLGSEDNTTTLTINRGTTQVYNISGWSTGSDCTEATLTINYNRGDLTGQSISDSITAKMTT